MGNPDKQSYLYKINEIFYSIQAEGYWAGRPAIFIRFSGCNLRCEFCDTEFLSGIEMSISDIMAQISNYPAKFIVITGGEPLLNDTAPLVKELKAKDYYVAVETNGTIQPKHDLFDWITVSPKNHTLKIKECNELKVVLGIDETPEDFDIKSEHKYISPKNPGHGKEIGSATAVEFDFEVAKYCYLYILNHPEWTLTLQNHKILGVQ